LAGGLNLYNYTANNPVNEIDPLGLAPDLYSNEQLWDEACDQFELPRFHLTPLDFTELALMAVFPEVMVPVIIGGEAAKKLSTHIPTQGRKFNQLSRRGWSQNSVDNLVNNPHTTRESINKATGNKATAYFRKNGHYVVRDDVTGDIVQMSDTKLIVGAGQEQWRPDTSIKDPYIP